MILRYLGTAAAEGIPALFCSCPVCALARKVGGREVRTRSGALIDGRLKLDFPPDSYLHQLRDGLDYTDLEHLLITHSHDDHFALHDLGYRRKGFANLPEGLPPLTVYGNDSVGRALEPLIREAPDRYAFHQMVPFVKVQVAGYQITPLPAQHMQEEACLIYLIERAGKKILYAHDTGIPPEESLEALAGQAIDLISLDCTCVADDTTRGHMGLSACRQVRARLLDSGAAAGHTRFVLNHFSHNGRVSHAQLVQEAPEFTVAYDGLEVEA